MEVIPSGTSTEVKPVLEKAAPPIRTKLLGIITDDNKEHSEKAYAPMFSIPTGKLNLLSILHPKKASFSIVRVCSGINASCRSGHL